MQIWDGERAPNANYRDGNNFSPFKSRTHRNILSVIGQERTNGGFWPAEVCPLLTQQRHWLCTAAMVLTGIGRQPQTYMPRRPRWIASSIAFIVGLGLAADR